MQFAQGIGPWQDHLPTSERLAGYRADEYSVRVIMMRWKILVPFFSYYFVILLE